MGEAWFSATFVLDIALLRLSAWLSGRGEDVICSKTPGCWRGGLVVWP